MNLKFIAVVTFSFFVLNNFTAAAPTDNGPVMGPEDITNTFVIPNMNLSALEKEDRKRDGKGELYRFAVQNEVFINPSEYGLWGKTSNGKLTWSLYVRCENALSINLGFGFYTLPASGKLKIKTSDGRDSLSAFTSKDNHDHGELWTPVLISNEILIEAEMDPSDRDKFIDGLTLTSINTGYRGFGDYAGGRGSSESCNVDVVCPESQGWENEIESVGMYTLNGSFTCSGAMVNNTAQDETPYFMTADHCGVRTSTAPSMVVYWDHENTYCRTPGSGDSGGSGNGNYNRSTSGATFRATNSTYDCTLVELSSSPNPAWEVNFAGWSRSSATPTLGVGIHHPNTAEMRISFPDQYYNSGNQYWGVNWGLGRTYFGSSGSPLFDSNHRIIGMLCCGASFCTNDSDDYYGQAFVGAWSSLSPYLDPIGSNVSGIDTLIAGGGPECGDGVCEGGEDPFNCPDDCGPPPVCGDGFCDAEYEDGSNCFEDCCASLRGGCAADEIADCNGICAPLDWIGDGYCDNGAYDYNGNLIYLNCDEFNCDNGDCTDCSGGGEPDCGNGICEAGEDATNCPQDCDNGGGGGDCPAGFTADCQGTCFPDELFTEWVGDTYCDDGTYIPSDYGCTECPVGVPFYANCDQFNCDNGDCTDCSGGGGDPICGNGICEVGENAGNCPQDCDNGGGNCTGSEIEDCDGSGECHPADWIADGYCDGTDQEYEADLCCYENDGGDCSDAQCYGSTTGACCFGDTCSVLSVDDCLISCGEYQGDGTSCGIADICGKPLPLGACCIANTCSVVTLEECESNEGDYLGNNTSCESSSCSPPSCEGDVNIDGQVNVLDLLQLVSAFGPCVGCDTDFVADGVVNTLDLLVIVGNFGECD